MAVNATHLTTGSTAVDATSFTTASVTPSVNKLQLFAVRNRILSGTGPNIPTLAGNGLTWTLVRSVLSAGNTTRLSVFRALSATAPSAGTIVIDFAGQTQDNCEWSLNEFDPINTAGVNGINAVVQSVENQSSGVSTGLAATLAAFNDAGNATYGAVGVGPTVAVTPGAGFTEKGESAAAAEGVIETEFLASNDTSVDWSWASTSVTALAIAIEINSLVNVAPTVTTSAVSNLAHSSVTLNGNVSSDGNDTITERGFVYSTTNPVPTTADTKQTVAGTTGALSSNISGLIPQTTYYVRAYAINSTGTGYGSVVSFTTTAVPITNYASTRIDGFSNISKTRATMLARVDTNDSSGISKKGIVYATTPNPTITDFNLVVPGTADGLYSAELTNLTANTRYFAKSYILYNGTYRYSPAISFLTASVIVNKYFYYKIFTAGVYTTTWTKEVITEPRFKTIINNGGGEMVIELARPFDEFGEDVDVKLNNKVECWVVDKEKTSGQLLFTGYISGYRPIISERKESVSVTVLGYASQLQRIILRDSLGNTTLAYNSYDPSNILKDVIDKYRAQGGELNYSATSIDLTNTVVSYTFNTNNIKECLDKIIELSPESWYYRIDPDGIIYLKPKTIVADHTFTLGLDVEHLETFRRTENLVNQVLFIGGGNPALFRKYNNTGSIAAYGLYEQKIVDQRVTVVATAQTMANRIINMQKDPEIRSIFEIVDSNGPKARGYDIETVKVGQTLRVRNLKSGVRTGSEWDIAFWNTDVWDQSISSSAADVIQILSVQYTPDSIIIEASSRLPQIAKRIEDIDRNLAVTQGVNNPSSPT